MTRFDASSTDELAMLDGDRGVLGILRESFVRRRYAEELEKASGNCSAKPRMRRRAR